LAVSPTNSGKQIIAYIPDQFDLLRGRADVRHDLVFGRAQWWTAMGLLAEVSAGPVWLG